MVSQTSCAFSLRVRALMKKEEIEFRMFHRSFYYIFFLNAFLKLLHSVSGNSLFVRKRKAVRSSSTLFVVFTSNAILMTTTTKKKKKKKSAAEKRWKQQHHHHHMTKNLYAFEIEDFDTTSTISWALDNCSENKKERFCEQMGWTGDVELL